MKEFFVDYRFIVKADDEHDAGTKVDAFLPESDDDIWYTIDKIEESYELVPCECGSPSHLIKRRKSSQEAT